MESIHKSWKFLMFFVPKCLWRTPSAIMSLLNFFFLLGRSSFIRTVTFSEELFFRTVGFLNYICTQSTSHYKVWEVNKSTLQNPCKSSYFFIDFDCNRGWFRFKRKLVRIFSTPAFQGLTGFHIFSQRFLIDKFNFLDSFFRQPWFYYFECSC